jgi:hypothetical protein
MATAALVDRDLDIGRRILAGLAKARIPVNVAFWAYVPQIGEWQLYIATPLVDSIGPKSAYARVLSALHHAGMDPELPWRRIFLRSPRDPILKSLEKKAKSHPEENYRINAPIGGRFIEDAYLYSGSLDIQEFENQPRGTAPSTYYVTYAPYSGPGAATVLVTGADLEELLVSKLHISQSSVGAALRELSAKKRVIIPNVQLGARDLKRLRSA